MARIMAVDYGQKRTGIAVTDPLQIIASALTTVPTGEALKFIRNYAIKEDVQEIIIGLPVKLNNEPADIVPEIEAFIRKLSVELPGIPMHRVDERFTSKMATRSLIESGQNKKTRRDKSVIDKVSATLLLQSWLEQKLK